MQNINGIDGIYIPIAPGPIDGNRGRKKECVLPDLYIVKTRFETRKKSKTAKIR